MSHNMEEMDETIDRPNVQSEQSAFVDDLRGWLGKGKHIHTTSTPFPSVSKVPDLMDTNKGCDSGIGPSPDWGLLSLPDSQSIERFCSQSRASFNDSDLRPHPQVNLLMHFEEFKVEPTSKVCKLQKRRSLQEESTPSPFRNKRRLSLDLDSDSRCDSITPSFASGSEIFLQSNSSMQERRVNFPLLRTPDLSQNLSHSDARTSEDSLSTSNMEGASSPLVSRPSSLCNLGTDLDKFNEPVHSLRDVCYFPATAFSEKVHLPVALSKYRSFEERLARRKMELDREIGHRIGTEFVDFLGELYRKRFYEPITVLLRHLTEEDLCSLRLVSHLWKSALDFDSRARNRREKYVADRRRQMTETPQENRLRAKKLTRRKVFTAANRPMTVIQSVQHISPVKSSSAAVSNAELFLKEAKSLSQHEALRKCPKCNSPARVNPVGRKALCTKDVCQFEFCVECRMSLHSGRDCVTQIRKPVEPKIGSKSSRQNLRRL